jgi:hypothetical protein
MTILFSQWLEEHGKYLVRSGLLLASKVDEVISVNDQGTAFITWNIVPPAPVDKINMKYEFITKAEVR